MINNLVLARWVSTLKAWSVEKEQHWPTLNELQHSRPLFCRSPPENL